MAPTLTRADRLSLGLAALTLGSGLLLWPRLPAEMAIHFSASGEPDRFVSKPIAVASMPLLMVATLVFIDAAARLDPPEDPSVLGVVTVATMTLLAAAQGYVFAENLGYAVPLSLFMAGVAVWVVFVVGYTVVRERTSLPA